MVGLAVLLIGILAFAWHERPRRLAVIATYQTRLGIYVGSFPGQLAIPGPLTFFFAIDGRDTVVAIQGWIYNYANSRVRWYRSSNARPEWMDFTVSSEVEPARGRASFVRWANTVMPEFKPYEDWPK